MIMSVFTIAIIQGSHMLYSKTEHMTDQTFSKTKLISLLFQKRYWRDLYKLTLL